MAIACFIRQIELVEAVAPNTYRITAQCNLMDGTNSTFTMSFEAVKGADWRIQARSAAVRFALESYGETVDLVITPGLETL